VSPWTVGGYVCSDAFDHTSILQFIEAVCFGGAPTNPNITAWRRATFGNMTSAFQSTPATTPPSDPNFTYSATSAELATQTANTSGSTKLPLPAFPASSQTPPAQQSGSRPSIG
jgi:phospholipase C